MFGGGALGPVSHTFRGESLNKVDSKGRVSIPADYRAVLRAADPERGEGEPPRVVIVYGFDDQTYLECYTMEAAAEVDSKIRTLPRKSKRRQTLERYFHTRSHLTSVDETGRLVLPQKLRDKIGLTDTAYFAATSDTFQIWKPEIYEAETAKEEEELLADLAPGVHPLELLDGEEG